MAVPSVSNGPPQKTRYPLTKNWCSTQVKIEKLTYTWTINNFSFCRDLESSNFSAGENNKVKWRLRLYPKGSKQECSDHVSLFLVLVSSDKSELMAKFKFAVLDEKSEKKHPVSIKTPHNFKKGTDWGFAHFIKRDFLFDEGNKLLRDDIVKIFCEINMVGDTVNISEESNGVEVKIPECQLSDDFEQLLEARKFCDATLFVGDREFQVHKAILAARSPVFAAMFEHNMAEREQNRAEITDVDEEVMKEMLRYMYTGRTADIDRVAYRLLAAADKYALERLKSLCEESISARLTVDSAADVLILADLHGAVQLKARAIAFMNRNAAEVMETSGWEAMVISHPQLMADTFRALVTSKKLDL